MATTTYKHEPGKRPNLGSFLDLQKYMLKVPADRLDALVEDNDRDHKDLGLKAVQAHMQLQQALAAEKQARIADAEAQAQAAADRIAQLSQAADDRAYSVEVRLQQVQDALVEEQQRSRDLAAMEQKVNHFEVVAEQITLAMEQKIEELEERLRLIDERQAEDAANGGHARGRT